VAQVDVLTGSRDGDAGACEREDAVLIVSPKVLPIARGALPETTALIGVSPNVGGHITDGDSALTSNFPFRSLKGPKTPMHGRLQENRRDGGASDVRGGAVDPEEPFIRQAKFLPI
jgi:hypothetical protein